MAPSSSRATRLLRAASFAATLTVPVVVLAVMIRGDVAAVVDSDVAAVTAATEAARDRPVLHRAAWAVATLLIAWGLANVAKYVVQRARPVIDEALGHSPGYSFPSGHSMNAMAAGLVLAILLWRLLSSRGRTVLTTAVAAFVLATGLDRVFLGAHYPSDVVAGFTLGAAVVGASWLGHRGWHPTENEELR